MTSVVTTEPTRRPGKRPLRAAIYCRISSDPTGDELGVRRQDRDCRALCARHGYDVVGAFTDDDRSAYSGKARPAFGAMTDLIASGGVDVVVAWHPDRLTRQPRELEDLIDLLERHSTTVRTCQTGEYDLSTPTGRMTARIVGSVARGESEHKSARLRRKHLELAEHGKIAGGGGRPYGYDDDRITVRPDEARVIRDVTARVLAGEALRSVCADLNRAGGRSSSGRTWTPHALRRMLLSARIAGMRSHHGAITATAVWPAIIDVADHHRLVAVLTDPQRTTNPGRERRLLTGLLVCGTCGARMVSRPLVDKRPSYVCAKGPGYKGCGGCKVLGDPVEQLVVAAVLERLASPDYARAVANRDRAGGDDDLAVLAELDDRAAALGAMWAAGDLDPVSWKAARDGLEQRRRDAQHRLATGAQTAAVDVLVADESIDWSTLTHGAQRAALAAVVEAVTIGPAVRGRNYFDGSRLSITWRV